MIKIAFNSSPLTSGHKTRGIGAYARNLLEQLKRRDDIKIQEFSDISEVGNVDLVHYPFFDFFQRSLPIRKKIPTIVTVHDVIPLIFPQHYPPGLRGTINKIWQRMALRDISAVITDSECSKKDIINYLSVPASKIYPIYLAPSIDFKPIKDSKKLNEVRGKYGLPSKFSIYVGSVNWNKNIVNLTQASLDAGVDIVLVGRDFEDKSNLDHPERRSYAKFIKKFGNHSQVHIFGFIPTEDLVTFINLAEVLLLPSYYEGFGLPILEAQACGTPVITSNLSSMIEVAGEGAIKVNPESSEELVSTIRKLLADHQIKNSLVEKGSENLARFSWDKVAKETFNVYQKALS